MPAAAAWVLNRVLNLPLSLVGDRPFCLWEDSYKSLGFGFACYRVNLSEWIWLLALGPGTWPCVSRYQYLVWDMLAIEEAEECCHGGMWAAFVCGLLVCCQTSGTLLSLSGYLHHLFAEVVNLSKPNHLYEMVLQINAIGVTTEFFSSSCLLEKYSSGNNIGLNQKWSTEY